MNMPIYKYGIGDIHVATVYSVGEISNDQDITTGDMNDLIQQLQKPGNTVINDKLKKAIREWVSNFVLDVGAPGATNVKLNELRDKIIELVEELWKEPR